MSKKQKRIVLWGTSIMLILTLTALFGDFGLIGALALIFIFFVP